MREGTGRPGPAPVLAGVLVGIMGMLIVLVAANIIRVDPSTMHAPRWVVAAAGLAFAVAGLWVAVARPDQGKDAVGGRMTISGLLLGITIIALMAAVANWIAFGPGERRFGGGLSVPFVTISSRASEWSGRAVFGLGAVMLDALLLWSIVKGVKDLRRAGRA